MALVSCPECTKQISDKAETCPNCGFPIKLETELNIVKQKKQLEDDLDAARRMQQKQHDDNLIKARETELGVEAFYDELTKKTLELYKSHSDKGASKEDWAVQYTALRNDMFAGKSEEFVTLFENYSAREAIAKTDKQNAELKEKSKNHPENLRQEVKNDFLSLKQETDKLQEQFRLDKISLDDLIDKSTVLSEKQLEGKSDAYLDLWSILQNEDLRAAQEEGKLASERLRISQDEGKRVEAELKRTQEGCSKLEGLSIDEQIIFLKSNPFEGALEMIGQLEEIQQKYATPKQLAVQPIDITPPDYHTATPAIYVENDTAVICPRCKARNAYHASGKGFGLGKAAVGGILLGPVGLLGGLFGSKKLVIQCIKCGNKWSP